MPANSHKGCSVTMSQFNVRRLFLRIPFLVILTCTMKCTRSSGPNHEACEKLAKEPEFDLEMILGGRWNIFYGWKDFLNKDACLDMQFYKSTPWIEQRFLNYMYEYIESQPSWQAATFLMTIGRHEVLFFADQGPAGKFLGVPNLLKANNLAPDKNSVPLFNLQFKLLENGRYLLMADCTLGLTTLATKQDLPANITDLINNVGLGEGFFVCKKSEDQFLANKL